MSMNIRLMEERDQDPMIEIWLRGSEQAHHFIPMEYWSSKQSEMRNVYLPMSESYVLEIDGHIRGFISMVGSYLAALFIDPEYQSQGYGRKLLDHIKSRQERLELKVYKANEQAVQFYTRHGFKVQQEMLDPDTRQPEYLMEWTKSK